MKTLSSRDNAQVKRLHALAHSARERRKLGLTLLDGVHLVEVALARGVPLAEVYVSDEGLARAEIVALLARCEAAARVVHLQGNLFAHVSPVETPSGILALIDMPSPAAASVTAVAAGASILLLDGVQDPGNLGTILRTAASAGVRDVFLGAGCTQAWSPRALRAGMGGQFELAIREGMDPIAVLDAFPGPALATALDDTARALYDLDLRGPVAWLFGAEGLGLSPALLARADMRVMIPMPGAVESLNVGAAVAVCLFEQVRQRLRG